MNMVFVETARRQPHRPAALQPVVSRVSGANRILALPQPRQMTADRPVDGGEEGANGRIFDQRQVHRRLRPVPQALAQRVVLIGVLRQQRRLEVDQIGRQVAPAGRRINA